MLFGKYSPLVNKSGSEPDDTKGLGSHCNHASVQKAGSIVSQRENLFPVLKNIIRYNPQIKGNHPAGDCPCITPKNQTH